MRNVPVATIHLDAIQRNVDFARELAPKSKIMAIVKADAYGHGAVEVSRALKGVAALGVARVEEGVTLREAGITDPILVLEGFIDSEELEISRINRLVPVLHGNFQVDTLKSSKHADLPVWMKVDTGMHRLGFSVEEFRRGMTTGEALSVVGVMSHLANADDPENRENDDQISIFDELTRDIDCELSIASSGAIVNYPNSHFDWIRPGIMLYGGSPTGRPDARLANGMTLEAPVVSVNAVRRGESIGYGGLWEAKADTRVAVIGIGYADGYPREAPQGTPVAIGGVRRPIVGRISMDMTFVELEPEDVVRPGDPAQLWGPLLPVDEVARAIGTISYTLVSSLTSRVHRRFPGGTA